MKHDVKSRLTLSATGAEGGEGPRNHIQVLANSAVATVLSIAHALVLAKAPATESCFSLGHNAADVLMVGIVAFVGSMISVLFVRTSPLMQIGPYSNYAAVAADTFSSELGILSKSKPRLITSWNLRQVPPGTNGGVTATGLGAGLLGSFTIAFTSAMLLPFCPERSGIKDRALWAAAMTCWGLLGSVLDSVLGGLLQASVVDKRSGKVVEGSGGRKVCLISMPVETSFCCWGISSAYSSAQVLIHPGSTTPGGMSDLSLQSGEKTGSTHLRTTEAVANTATLHGSRVTGTSVGTQAKNVHEGHVENYESRRIESGHDWLDNNGVNMLMAVLMSVGAMGIAQQAWGVDMRELWL